MHQCLSKTLINLYHLLLHDVPVYRKRVLPHGAALSFLSFEAFISLTVCRSGARAKQSSPALLPPLSQHCLFFNVQRCARWIWWHLPTRSRPGRPLPAPGISSAGSSSLQTGYICQSWCDLSVYAVSVRAEKFPCSKNAARRTP